MQQQSTGVTQAYPENLVERVLSPHKTCPDKEEQEYHQHQRQGGGD